MQDFLVVQWLRLHTSKAGGPGSTPGQGTRFHTPQVKIPCATMKTQCSPTNRQKYFYRKKKVMRPQKNVT